MNPKRLFQALVPTVCAVCRSTVPPGSQLCAACLASLDAAPRIEGDPPPGIRSVVSVAAHEGTARAVLAAYKFGGQFALAALISERMSWLIPRCHAAEAETAVVPVPASVLRRRMRGFDTASELAGHVAGLADLAVSADVIARRGWARQRGRGRASRLGDPPSIVVLGRSPGRVILVDDVMTTGATLAACAVALAEAGAAEIDAVTFTRRP